MKRLFVLIVLLISVDLAGLPLACSGAELEFDFGQGIKRLKEHGDLVSAPRFIQAGISVSGGEKFYRSITLEAWKAVIFEDFALDNSSIKQGGGLLGLLGYRVIKTKDVELTPVLGLYYSYWERSDPNPKWVNNPDPGHSSWTNLSLGQGVTGINFSYKWFYTRANLTWPFYFSGDTASPSNRKLQSHEPHLRLDVGIKWHNWAVYHRYEKQSVDQIENNIFTDMFSIGLMKRF